MKWIKRVKEKLKAIYHILIDSEYIVFTITMRNSKRKSSSALISDNATDVFVETAIDVLKNK